MGVFKKVFRKLSCRPERNQDEENQLEADLMEASQEPQEYSKQKTKRNKSKKASKNKKKNKSNEDDSRFMLELQQRDPFTIKEVTGKYIDIPASFSPKPKWWMTVIKLIICAWVSFITADGFFRQKSKSFYMATFDHWASVVTVVYLWFSFLVNAMRPSSKNTALNNSPARNLPSMWHKITWALFAVAAPSQIFSSMAFWLFEYNGNLEDGLVTHGSVLLLLLVEGLCINRTPLRINHQWFFMVFVYAFLLWSLIHSYLGMGNPQKSINGDGTLYSFLDWNGAPIATALHVMMILLLVVPFIYWIVWMLSLFSLPWRFDGKVRRYLNGEQSKAMEKHLDD